MAWTADAANEPGNERTRARRFRDASRHTRFVRVLRYVLPVVAICLLGIMFLSGLRSPLSFLPEGVNLDGLSFDGDSVTMERPHLTGFSNDGNGYEVRADRAVHVVTNPKVLELFDVSGVMTEPTGRRTRLMAEYGVFDGNEEFLTLSQGIEIDMDGGYRVFLDNAEVDMAGGTVVTEDPVRIETGGADLVADTLEITEGGKHFMFVGNVRMTIYPDVARGETGASADSLPTGREEAGG